MILQPFKVGPRKWPILEKLPLLSQDLVIVVSVETRLNSASIHTN